MKPHRIVSLFAASVALAAMADGVQAQKLYRYVDENGRVTYSERPPVESTGKAVDRISKQGVVVERGQAAPSAEQRAQAEADRKKQAEDEIARRTDERRTQAIMSAYASEAEIRGNRENTLKPVRDSIAQAEAAIAKADSKVAGMAKAVDAEKGRPVEAKLRRELQIAESERTALQRLLEGKRKEEQSIEARFDEDLRRFIAGSQEREARKEKRGSPAGATPVATGAGGK